MPSTAEPEGYTAEKAKGNIKVIPGQGQDIVRDSGWLSPGFQAPVEEIEVSLQPRSKISSLDWKA